MSVIMYSTGCPRCRALELKMNMKGVEFETEKSVEVMQELGIKEAPKLCVDGKMMGFTEAIAWVNKQ